MKILFDQNISFRIINKIANIFPEAKQVLSLGIENFSDIDIWNFAKENNFTIVTFDYDFFEISNFRGHPPKIIWLRFGNTSTNILSDIIVNNALIIKQFISNSEYANIACLEIR